MLPLRNPAAKASKCSGKLDSNISYFDSPNYEHLDCVIQRREEKRIADEKQRQRELEEESRKPVYPKTDFSALQPDSTPPPRPKQTYYGLRRPLENGEKIPIEPGDIDLEDWSDKPYSTIACQMLGYQDIYPLLMQKITASAEKDTQKVQTETRRHSLIEADYHNGRIKLQKGNKSKPVQYAVFPMLHRVIEDPSDEEDEDEDAATAHSPEIIPPDEASPSCSSASEVDDFYSESGTGLSRLRIELPSGFSPQRRRISIAGNVRNPVSPQVHVVRRRSLDYGGVSTAFVKALEAASKAMKSIDESDDEEDGEHHHHHQHMQGTAFANAARAVFDPKYAEETMTHLDDNLHTLEAFLQQSDGNLVLSDDEDDDY